MLAWLSQNLATIIISALLLLIVALILRKLWKNRKSGGACGCGCGDCNQSCPFSDKNGDAGGA